MSPIVLGDKAYIYIVFRSLIDDVRYQFQTGNTITRLIIINVAIFLGLVILRLILNITEGATEQHGLFARVTNYIFLNQDVLFDAKHPWVLLSHMFTHTGFFHMLFNMLVLYWFGRIAGDLLGDHRMLPLYLFSGLTGALLYLIFAPAFYASSTLHGASGAIMGIVAAAGMTAPDYQMRLLLFGDVRLKYIVFGLLLMYLVSLSTLENAGGQMAHFGGAAFGFFYVHMLRRGHDLTAGFRNLTDRLSGRRRKKQIAPRRRVPMEVRQRKATSHREIHSSGNTHVTFIGEQERLDHILEKIKKTGFDSLNEDEKKFLHDASQK